MVALRNCGSCGQPAPVSLTVRHRYPRAVPEPKAMDPYYVHGGSGFGSCGSPACDAAMMLAHRAQVLASVRELSGRELAAGELDVVISRPEHVTYSEQADGTVQESWPAPPPEAV
jgi:hypothetical protein